MRQKFLAEKATRRLEQPVDAAKTVAGEALGAAAIAATGVREQLRTDVGGGSGIRTHVTVSRKHAFQACAFSHSATPPDRGLIAGHILPSLAQRAFALQTTLLTRHRK